MKLNLEPTSWSFLQSLVDQYSPQQHKCSISSGGSCPANLIQGAIQIRIDELSKMIERQGLQIPLFCQKSDCDFFLKVVACFSQSDGRVCPAPEVIRACTLILGNKWSQNNSLIRLGLLTGKIELEASDFNALKALNNKIPVLPFGL